MAQLQTDQNNLENGNQNKNGTPINTPLGSSGMGNNVGLSKEINRHSPKEMDDAIELDETDPDVIPNQYGKWKVKWSFINVFGNKCYSFCFHFLLYLQRRDL